MTTLYNDPAKFADDMLAGFVDAHDDLVRAVPGGVVRAPRPRKGKVAVVVGGGSGHYPAFCGVVGPGFADGAVVGNVFTSPSTRQAVTVARAADAGGGVLLTYGNYAGDVMNFGLAEQRLNDAGIPARTVLVTDDVASASADEEGKRRGIAGDFAVFKIASAAAEEGLDLDGVADAATRANAATRSLGVAFDGCTMPGADEPLFTVPDGKVALGLGIHGEPGISEHESMTADELARLLVDGVLAERPAGAGTRVTAILNGLGRTKYEELFIVWKAVAALLRDEGLDVAAPEVGELVTSLDMAGCSLTLVFLDDDLERWWSAPALSPAYTKAPAAGWEVSEGERAAAIDPAELDPMAGIEPAGEQGRRTTGRILAALEAVGDVLHDHEDELGRIDAVAGDGDHGRGMVKGIDACLRTARAAAEKDAGPADALRIAGDAWATEAGGTSGVLWGAALAAFGARLPGDHRCETADLAAAAEAALDAVRNLGKAQVGDKTLVDALVPFVDSLKEAAGSSSDSASGVAWRRAAEAATTAARQTADLTPKLGRARPLADKSVGTPDAGATSLGMVVTAAADAAWPDD
ncbi:dihydroxyacetone kinase family protein [Spelaeicoccus albus]|uniref:Dihydroxyacetone kinase n=1 Tax=Spelaeicoccus albus TaxID=1280376 RepID=A0A7Z0D1C0_9MICO|nr:dihydroxyacetone kinase family protein [Spelaeicoccus albus]NYI65997.1 dihydroxyacetone kinase [Spelaeicoccus albus]